jgi:hypothetical protein
MDQDGGLGEGGFHFVVIGNNKFQAEAFGLQGFVDAGDSTIDGDDHLDAEFGERAEGVGIEAVAFFEAVGDMEVRPSAEELEDAHEDGGAGDAVDIVIAIDADGASRGDGGEDAIDGVGDAREEVGGVKAAEGAIEETASIPREVDTAIEEELGDESGDLKGAGQAFDRVAIVRQ